MSPGLLILAAVALLVPAFYLSRDKRSEREYVLGAALAALALSAATLGWLMDLGYV